MTPEEQFIIQLVTIITGFIVTLATLYLKHRSDVETYRAQDAKIEHVAKAVNGIPGEPTVKEQTAIIQDTIRKEVLPRLADTNAAAHVAADAAQKEGC